MTKKTQFFDGFLIKFQKKSHSNNDRRQLISQKNFFFFFFLKLFFGTAIVRRPYQLLLRTVRIKNFTKLSLMIGHILS